MADMATAECAPAEPVKNRSALGALLDRRAIEACLAVHSRGVDRADPALLASAYHDDATVDYGFFAGLAAELVDVLVAAQRAGESTLHRTSNISIQFGGNGNEARSETYCIAYVETPEVDGPVQRLVGGRYLDRLAFRDGRWAIGHRQYVLDWSINRPTSVAWPEQAFAIETRVPAGGHAARDTGLALLTASAAWRDAGEKEKNMSLSVTDDAIDELIARQEISELITGYSRAVDRADAGALTALFHPDASVVTGVFNGRASDFAQEITGWLRANAKLTCHTVSNVWLSIRGDRAIGESYILGLNRDIGADPQDHIAGGRYLDRFERRDGTWRFSERVFVMDWNINQPSSDADPMYDCYQRGGYAPNDPIYAFWQTEPNMETPR
ncbi:MAG: nuclear transport factor 2 family protein [Sphingobium sp.]|nr:nuclear transport factor 2 family protein [Sphingobium sp.]